MFTRLKRLVLGEPLLAHHASDERIPKWKALSTLSSDALSSTAYATDAILVVLAGFSTAAAVWSIPIALGIAVLLGILTASYHQIIEAYPNGGGAYTVAKENLGTNIGLVAGAGLLIDYILTVSVSVASGVENIGAAFPFMLQHKDVIGCVVIVVIMLMNLRGIRESATIFAFPTYFFMLSIFVLVGVGLWKTSIGEIPRAAPVLGETYAAVPMILIMRAFASGCAALTGVEAISNGVPVFRPPSARNAKITLICMAAILATLFLSITMLAHITGIIPTESETLISLLGRAVYKDSWPYYMTQGATALILFLAANTAYAGFPWLTSLLARDRFLPRQLTSVGDRLVFSNGILGLSFCAAAVLVIFHGDTIHILPLYAVGVFLSFTLSQAGMVIHHLRDRKPGWIQSLLLNALGAITTFAVMADIAFTKFAHGAWMVIVAIGVIFAFFHRIHRHYLAVGRELTLIGKLPPARFQKIKHTVVIPISGIHQGVLEALQYALTISEDVRAVYVEIDPAKTKGLQEEWERWVPGVPFVTLKSPYRSVVTPLINYIDDVEQTAHDDMVTVVVPEFVTSRWWHNLLHNQTALFIRAALALRRRRVVTSVRYHIRGR